MIKIKSLTKLLNRGKINNMEYLTADGKIVLLDPEDLERISKYNWRGYCDRGKYGTYFQCSINKKTTKLHRFILGVTDPKISIDHINRNTFDNRKCNLRICEKGAQNAINRPKQRNNTTGYKGVFQRKDKYLKEPVYRAAIRVEQRLLHLGHFKDPKDAAKAYNEAAKKYFGEFAYLNPIEE